MNLLKKYFFQFVVVMFIGFSLDTHACSMYKITADGKTMVGCNEDAWRTTPRIWFHGANKNRKYGVCFTGSRQVSPTKFAPQSGMNEAGLVFSRLASFYPKVDSRLSDKKTIKNEVKYLSNILYQCKNIEEVKEYISQYDQSFFSESVFIYIDQTGKYLVVEPHEMIEGDDPSYVLSNFCPSITDNEVARQLDRYKKGEDFLKNKNLEASLPFCQMLSDTMHVCRERNGDGTLLTTIWDSQQNLVNVFFYHDFENAITFHLRDELAKGDHILEIPSLFPENKEFQRLETYVTPFNTPALRIAMVFLGGIMASLALLLFFMAFKNKSHKFRTLLWLLGALNVFLIFHLAVLATNKGPFYMDAPFIHYQSKLISASSYAPLLLTILILPIFYYCRLYLKENVTKIWQRIVLVFNQLIYLMLLFGFGYWGLLSVF